MLRTALLLTALSTEPKMPTDEEAMHAMHDSFRTAWSRGDSAAAAAMWTEDGVRVGAAGDVQHGRKEIAAALDALLNGRFKGAAVKFEHGAVRMLGPELALYQGPMEIVPPGGAPPIRGYYVDVMKRVSAGKWLILESHPKLFPPPPPPAK